MVLPPMPLSCHLRVTCKGRRAGSAASLVLAEDNYCVDRRSPPSICLYLVSHPALWYSDTLLILIVNLLSVVFLTLALYPSVSLSSSKLIVVIDVFGYLAARCLDSSGGNEKKIHSIP